MRRRAWPLLVLLAMSPARAATDGAMLDAVLRGFQAVRHVEARYVERRYLAVLRAPLETRGVLRFEAPDRLEKDSDPGPDGASERVLVTGGQLRVERGGARPVVLDLREHPEIGALVDSLRALLAGDGAALRRDFDIDVAGQVAGWEMVLRPRRADLVRWLRIDGAGPAISRVETQETGGDRSEMTIGDTPR